jgi:hypothetical protein
MARDLAEAAVSTGVRITALREQAERMADYLFDHEQLELELARRRVEGA